MSVQAGASQVAGERTPTAHMIVLPGGGYATYAEHEAEPIVGPQMRHTEAPRRSSEKGWAQAAGPALQGTPGLTANLRGVGNTAGGRSPNQSRSIDHGVLPWRVCRAVHRIV
jgi:hypothetical protein